GAPPVRGGKEGPPAPPSPRSTAATGGGGGRRRATAGRWSGASGRNRGAAGIGGCTGSAGRRKAPSPGTSGGSARPLVPGRTPRASASATCACSPTTSCSSQLPDRGFQQSNERSEVDWSDCTFVPLPAVLEI